MLLKSREYEMNKCYFRIGDDGDEDEHNDDDDDDIYSDCTLVCNQWVLKWCWSDVPVRPMAAGGVLKRPPERVRNRLSI